MTETQKQVPQQSCSLAKRVQELIKKLEQETDPSVRKQIEEQLDELDFFWDF